jgi:cell wall assembly regulator SMI1
MMHEFVTVIDLLSTLQLPPGEKLPGGVDRATIAEAEARLGLAFPDTLRNWLALTNGPCVGPGGVFGVKTEKEFLDLEHVSGWFPGWRVRGWIPIAGDGSGNYYILVQINDDWPVCFVDTTRNPDAISFVVASDLAQFLSALFAKEAGSNGWPFDRALVMARDPRIERFRGILPLPWEAQ